MITTTDEIYHFVGLAIQNCREYGYDNVAQQLDDAMQLGSSGLEILGAIRAVFNSNRPTLEKVVDKDKLQDVIRYVNNAFGTE